MFFKYELLRIIKTKKSILFMILLLIIPFMDLYDNYIGSFKDFWDYPEAYGGVLPYDDVLHPTFASFLSANSEVTVFER